jgi:hypothetical protein
MQFFNLAKEKAIQYKYEEAEVLIRQALSAQEEWLKKNKTEEAENLRDQIHSYLLYIESNLLRRQKKLKEALAKLEKARRLHETKEIMYYMAYMEEYIRTGKIPWKDNYGDTKSSSSPKKSSSNENSNQ